MEHLPVEIIGDILSRLGSARETVIASATCKKWREARRNHLHTLSFHSDDWIDYHYLTTTRLETIITQTILQTTGLQCLSINLTFGYREFLADSVIAWLTHTRYTLRKLHYNFRTTSSINILEICDWHKLEDLVLSYNYIGVGYLKFPALKSLSLTCVSISVLDLSLLLTACPKLEVLALIDLDMDTDISDEEAIVELASASLKDIYVESISFEKFILNADSLENLHLKNCTLELFELVGKGSLRVLRIGNAGVKNLDIGDNTDNLEVVEFRHFTIAWRKFYHIISRSSKLKRLSLWGFNSCWHCMDGDEIVDLETISVCCPQLSQLSLSYDEWDGKLCNCGLQGSSHLQNVTVLELGWTVMINGLFSERVAGLLERCPSLKKLVLHGILSRPTTHEECQILADFNTSVFRLMRKYMHIDVQFEYK